MKSMFKWRSMVLAGAAVCLAALPARAGEEKQAQAKAGDAAEIAALELAKKGVLAGDQVEAFKVQLRERLQLRDGESLNGLCSGAEQAQCQARLQTQVRDCDGEGRQHGSIKTPEDAVRVAAAVMLAASRGQDIEEAGNAVREQLKKKWRSEDVEGAARAMSEMRKQERWQKQARQMVQECVSDDSCSPEQARVALVVMHQASGQAELDARQAKKEIRLVLREQMTQGAKGQDGKVTGDALKARLQKRLRLRAQEGSAVAGSGSGEQQRNRYRRGMDGELRQGGGFGGRQSGGVGTGIGDGKGPGSSGSTGTGSGSSTEQSSAAGSNSQSDPGSNSELGTGGSGSGSGN